MQVAPIRDEDPRRATDTVLEDVIKQGGGVDDVTIVVVKLTNL